MVCSRMCYNRQSLVVRALVAIASLSLFKVTSQLENFEKYFFKALWSPEKMGKHGHPDDNQQLAAKFFKSQVN